MKHLKLFFALFAMLALGVGNAWAEVYFEDSFSNVGTNSNATVSSRTGWTSLTQCYGQYNSGLRIGSSKNAGTLTKTAMTNISGTKDLKVTIYTAKYSSDGNSFTITTTNGTITSVTGVGKLSNGTLTVSPANNAGVTSTTAKATWKDAHKTEFIISGATSSTTIKFATNKRAILGPVTIEDAASEGDDDEIEEVDLGDLLKWSTESATATMGADNNEFPILTNTNGVDVTYTSSTPATATIDATGNITLVAAGTTTISAFYEGGDDAGDGKVYAAKTVSYTLTVKPAPLVIEPIEGGIIDILTHKTLAATSNSYTSFTGKQATNENHSDAVYAGSSARNGNATQYSIQLNTPDKKGRIATTTSGGIAKRVYVRWSTQVTLNTNNRTLDIYGSNNAYTGNETAVSGTKIGSVKFTTGAAEAYVDLTGDYKYILMTGSGAIYMDEIQVTWVVAEGTVTTPTISGTDEFIESTEVTIAAEDGLKVYYTLDGTDPTNASTEYTAPFELTATTTVKAVAYDGENASDIASKTFKQLQVLTCEEAAARCTSIESADKYVIRGYVTNIATAWSDQYSNISFWMADTKDGDKVFEAFRVQPIIAAEKSVKVGDYVEVIGKIVLYNTTPETSAGGTYTIIPAPVTYDYYIAGTLAGGWSATQQGMEKDGDVYKHTFRELNSGIYQFKITDGQFNSEGDNTHEHTTLGAAYKEVSYNDGNIQIITEEAINLTVIFDATADKITFEGLTPKYTVEATVNPAEVGTIEGADTYTHGTEVTLTATANDHYVFVNWTVGEEVVSTENPYTFNVTADVALVANFKKKTYTVTANATNGTVTGAGTYEHGATATLTATPAFDYQFVKWSNGLTENPLTITVEDNIELQAIFEEVAATEKKESGVFSISAHKTATFATGNLQYNVGTGEWRFAKQQYQVVGEQNIQLGHPDFTGWIDMLGWSTNDEGNNFGVNPSNVNELYDGEFVDWGTKMGAEWSTLSADDWKYLLNTREDAATLKQIAKVGDILGLLLFPDGWVMPVDVVVDAEKDEYFEVDVYNYTLEQWTKLEQEGALFLPAAGRRTGGYGNMINYDQVEEKNEEMLNGGYYRHQDNTNIYCYYWTSTINEETKNVSYLHNIVALGNEKYTIGTGAVWGEKGRYGQSVRLAKVVYDEHEVIVTAENGTVTGAGTYEHGKEVTLTATAAEGYKFVNWTENEVEVSTAAEYTFEVLADHNLVANFEKLTYTVTATATNGTVEGAGTYEHGAEVTLTATAAEGYEFVNWTSGETVVSTENPYKFTVTADVALVANFAKKTYTVTATAENGSVEGLAADGKYEHGATATLTATPAFDYEFVNWTVGEETITENPLTITITDNVTLEANFAEVAATEKKESGVFSISAHKTATFATGNLQYHTGDKTWRFAKQQYQVVGEQNINLGDPAFSGWIDMLGWSTNDEGNNFGVNPSNVNELYDGEFVDWGTKMGAEWSTLSADEWKYLLNTRANATQLKQIATIDTILGIMLFPDAWTMPEGCTVEAEKDEYFNVNIYNYTIAQWNEMEAAGAIFLPAAGRRTGGYGNKINYDQVEETDENNLNGGYYRHQDNTNIYCYYWTSTINAETKNVSYLHNIVALGNDEYTIGTGAIWGEKGRYGQSVRLAKVAYDTHTVKVTAENGTVEGAGTYEHGATATLTAAPAEHYVFVNWTKGEVVVAETAEYTFTVEADVELVANFKLDSHTVTATAENGTVTGADTYEHGTEVTLTATAAEGYEFVNWTSGETVVSTENPYKFTITADVALVANFEKVVPATETVYFINTKKWSAVKAYAWGGKATGTNWPGLATIKETEKIANNNVYSFTANVGDYANIIFNNNNQGSQTPDLVWTAGKYYVIDMGWLTKEEAEAKLAAPLPETWNIVGDAGLMGKGWDLNAAENAMTKQADGTYLLEKKDITITAGSYEYKAAKDHGWDVSVPQNGNQKLTISKSGIYDITFVLDVTAKTLKATTTLKKEAVVIPTVIIAGDMNSWDQTKDKFTMSADSLTATFKATLAVKNYGFKMIVGGAWHSDAKTITRANNSTKFTGANNNTNTTLKADVAGEYLFTWEYATKTLTVTYPARIYNINATAENGTVEGIGTYEHGDTITLIATPATGYKFRNWTTANSVVVSTEATYTFIATEDVELIANFYHETTIHCVPAGDLAWYLGQALPGDTLLLADGTYDEAYSIAFNKENIVVMAAEGAKPVIALTGEYTALNVSASTTFDGITFDGTNVAKYIIATLDSVEMDAELTIINCEFKNWTLWAISNQYEKNVSVNSVVIDNCLFHDGTGAAISFSNNAPAGKQACEYFEMTNSTLYKISESSYRGIINVGSNPEEEGDYNTVVIDHITMYDYTLINSGIAAIAIRKTHNLTISNSIIANPEENGQTALNVYGGTVDNTIHYNGAKRSGNTVYTNCLNVDPLFVDAANGNFALMPLSPARGAATDDSDLGDPRWYTSVNKYTVTATANPAEAGTVTGAGEYIEGVEVTLVATPERGYSFVNWTVEGEEVSTEATYTFTPSANIELVANFEEIEFTGNIINVEPGAFTLSAAIEAAQPGDMIVLADGEYSEEWSLVFNKEDLIIKAAEGAKPVVKIGSFSTHYATTTIIGVVFDGKFSDEKTAEHGIYSYENSSKSLTLIDCEIKNVKSYLISSSSSAHVDSLVLDGCLLHDCGAAAIYMQTSSSLPETLPTCSYFSITNSTVYNIFGTEYYGAIDIEEHNNGKEQGGTEVIIDHVTLYNFTTPQGGIRVHKSPNTSITNTIVANPTTAVANSFYVYGGTTVSNSLQYNCEKRSSSSINYVDIITADPMFTHAEHGIFCLQEGSPAIGAATDGTNLGDPRWNTPHYLVELSVLNPDHGTVEGAGVYKEGETVTVVAYAKPDYKFAAWIDNNYVNEEVTDRIYSFEITGDVNLQAEFEYEEGAQGDATDIENNIISNSQVMKVIQNGRLFIIREGKIYNAQGQVVK